MAMVVMVVGAGEVTGSEWGEASGQKGTWLCKVTQPAIMGESGK